MNDQAGRAPGGWVGADWQIGTHRSQEKLSEIIGVIYDCVLDPGHWSVALAMVNGEFSFASSALGVMPLRRGEHAISATAGFDEEWVTHLNTDTYRAESVVLWGGAESLGGYPLDEPVVASGISSYAGRFENRYFREVLEPRGLFDAIAIPIAREPSLIGYVAFNRHLSDGAISEAELSGMRLLGPHFRRAVTISSLFDLKAIEAASFASALDGFAFGLVLVDAELGIVHANEAAARMLATGDPIRSSRGRLALPARAAQEALERAVSQAATDEAGLGPRGIGIPARRAEGEPCVIHVLPLKRSRMRHGLAQPAAAALFVAPATARPRTPTDALALIYDLTPAEARVFDMISIGLTNAAISQTLGIASSTVKTHLLHLFGKTGCRRQADLIKLAAGLSMPI